MRKLPIFLAVILAAVIILIVIQTKNISLIENNIYQKESLHPLTIEFLKQTKYPGSDIKIEQTLEPGSNYQRYIASYQSEGLNIYALLTIPEGEAPESGWPVIIFNHGYIPPKDYRTIERYVDYTDAFSRSGYILLRPDYRGHGNSEGEARGGYGSNDYTIDVLNAVASIKKLRDPSTLRLRSGQASSGRFVVDTNRIGMWGHSMGGMITLKSMVVSKEIKAGVIWAGVVGSYPHLLTSWRRGNFSPPPQLMGTARRWRQELIDKFGTPEQNPNFWNSISANSYLSNISGPLQLHHGTADASVPVEFTEKLEEQMKKAGKEVETYIYPEDDHNLSNNLQTALQRSVEFFENHLK